MEKAKLPDCHLDPAFLKRLVHDPYEDSVPTVDEIGRDTEKLTMVVLGYIAIIAVFLVCTGIALTSRSF